ncbi:MAG: family 10 glycosylhydrolase [Candidatus Sumerlaeia bacterium]|nr:family 10 glycosylhydrolase [Candidatus Sumerlaeia bacterium]
MQRFRSFAALSCLSVFPLLLSPALAQPPAVAREFRGTWLTTVSLLDWPNSTSHAPERQKRDLITQLNELQSLGVNVVVFQIRSECDAIYASPYEPWSRYLTGTQGRAPAPLYDPLQFAIDETRRRGMELHAWMNPYRAGVSNTTTFAANHISRNGTPFVRTYESNFWLDPGHPDTVPYTVQIVEDVVTRYDVDGVHIDDYFYPYNTNTVPFPDDETFASNNPNNLTKENWRRANTRNLISSLYEAIHSVPGKNDVRFGVSPFGIYRPGIPAGISGLDSFSAIYIDSRQWLQQGLVDYMAPQLYWGREADGHLSAQDFDSLIAWWASPTQNPLGRHVIAGLPTYKVGTNGPAPNNQLYEPQHLINMITQTRSTPGAHGGLHFRTDNLRSTTLGVRTLLQNGIWTSANPSLTPATTWLDNQPPATPDVRWRKTGNALELQILPADSDDVRWVTLQYRTNQAPNDWFTQILPGRSYELYSILGGNTFLEVSVSTVDRSGNQSSAVTFFADDHSEAFDAVPSWTPLETFNSLTNNTTQALFRVPSASGTTTGINTGSTSAVTNTEWNNRLDPRLGAVISQGALLRWTWTVPGQGRVRATTSGASVKPNPVLDFNQGLSFAFKLPAGQLDLSLLLRETNTQNGGAPVAIGFNGGTTGPIEQTIPLRLNSSPNWQYVYIDLPNAKLNSFADGDGNLDHAYGVLEALLLEAVPGSPTATMEFYVDDFYQGPEMNPFGNERYKAETSMDIDTTTFWSLN